jgi:hypothetical protein
MGPGISMTTNIGTGKGSRDGAASLARIQNKATVWLCHLVRAAEGAVNHRQGRVFALGINPPFPPQVNQNDKMLKDGAGEIHKLIERLQLNKRIQVLVHSGQFTALVIQLDPSWLATYSCYLTQDTANRYFLAAVKEGTKARTEGMLSAGPLVWPLELQQRRLCFGETEPEVVSVSPESVHLHPFPSAGGCVGFYRI